MAIMYSTFDGNSLSREQLRAKKGAAAHVGQLDGSPNQGQAARSGGRSPRPDSAACAWTGDLDETERDDLAHAHVVSMNQKTPRFQESREWQGDEPNYPRDDLGGPCEPQAADGQEGTHHPKIPNSGFHDTLNPVPEIPPIDVPDLPPRYDDEQKKKHHSRHEKHLDHHEQHHHNYSQNDPEPVPEPVASVVVVAPAEARRPSAWMNTFDQVNKSIKQGLGVVTAVLAPAPRNQSPTVVPVVAEEPSTTVPAVAEEPVVLDKQVVRRQKREQRREAKQQKRAERQQRHEDHHEARRQRKDVKNAERERRRQSKSEERDRKQRERRENKQQAVQS
ncbi:hypothetical protein F5Y18DRAFT_220901 [Xylariaceae sp. FL1019]|nr:hypothetical protein F5Y18DRAFT_220901 [Xylariaceae sp. FL1019]